MKLSPQISLVFDGHCEAAFRFYERSLNGTILFMLTWANSPMAAEAPPGWESKIFHVSLSVGDTVISGSDPLPDRYERPRGFSIVLQMDDAAEAERVFLALEEDAQITMPLQQTFWAVRFGALIDQFGIPWAINCEAPAPTP